MNSCKVHSYKFICTSFHYLELVPYDLKQIYSLSGLAFAATEAGRPIWEYKNLGQVATSLYGDSLEFGSSH